MANTKSLIISVALITLVGAGIGFWYVNRDSSKNSEQPQSSSPIDQQQSSNASPEQSNISVDEWKVRAESSQSLANGVTYKISDPSVDLDGNNLMQATFYLKDSEGNKECVPTPDVEGNYIVTGIQLIRSEKGKPFNASRYRFNFMENVASDASYNYHLNYAFPACAGVKTEPQLTALKDALSKLQSY